MVTYVIGDVHGCYAELQAVLSLISYNPDEDDLWFLGDLINRGPESLQVLLLVHSLPRARVILGNHDLFLLAHIYRALPEYMGGEIAEVLSASNRMVLADWLCTQSLVHYDSEVGVLLVHAGLVPQWDLVKTLACARELEAVLAGPNRVDFFRHMMGNQPNCWDDDLTGWARLRCISKSLTRIRFCTESGEMNFQLTGGLGSQPHSLYPWYSVMSPGNFQVIFGHWASLQGESLDERAISLDGGCVWGGYLMAMRLSDRKIFRVKSQQIRR